MKKILFVHNYAARFTTIDRDILANEYDVIERYERHPARVRPLDIRRAVKESDLVFCWFASWHSLLPVFWARRLGKPSIVVVGGYDVANLPEIGYGSQRSGLRRWFARQVICRADQLIVTSDAARNEVITNAGADANKIRVLYPGVSFITKGASGPKRNSILTVGHFLRDNLFRKGLMPFVRAARLMPLYSFIVAGIRLDDSIEELRSLAPENVRILENVSDSELAALYAEARVYVQASLHEGFGMSVAEAMLAECIPVVTQVGSLPEVVGDTGVYILSQDPLEIAKGIQTALNLNGDTGIRARSRVQELFSVEQRLKGLSMVVNELLERGEAQSCVESQPIPAS